VSAATGEVSAERAAEFARLLELTLAIRIELGRGEWGAAADLELKRRKVIESVFDETPSAAELPVLTATLREVVRINDELIGLAEHRRRALVRDLDIAALGRSAVRAYGEAGAGAGARRA
jgi:hypothetical protein